MLIKGRNRFGVFSHRLWCYEPLGNGHNIEIFLCQVSFHNTVVFTVLVLISKITVVIVVSVLFTVVIEMFVQRFEFVSWLIVGIFSATIPLNWATTAKLGAPLAKPPLAEIFEVFRLQDVLTTVEIARHLQCGAFLLQSLFCSHLPPLCSRSACPSPNLRSTQIKSDQSTKEGRQLTEQTLQRTKVESTMELSGKKYYTNIF